MALIADYMGLGLSPFLANLLGYNSQNVTATGSSLASAAQLYGGNGIYNVTATATGSYVALPLVGGQSGCRLGDIIVIHNQLSASIQIVAVSAATLIGSAQAIAGNTGIVITTGRSATFIPVTATTYGYTSSN